MRQNKVFLRHIKDGVRLTRLILFTLKMLQVFKAVTPGGNAIV